MYIVDLNQVMISNFMVQIGNHTNIKVEEDLLRHMVLNSLRSYNVKFRDEYGEMIIACDDRGSWRKQIFPYYKANRKKDREDSELDWTAIFESLNKIREELKAHFPYRVIQIDSAEADDVIGTLCHEFGNTSEKILIISGDKDFRQLHGYMNVRQYDPVRKKWLEENNAERFLKEHIMKGDRGDGVPNFLSRDDCFVLNTRQKPLTTKKIDLWVTLDPQVFCDENMLRGWKRNEQMIDLNFIPTNIRTSVIESYNNQKGKGRDQLFTYFVEHKLKNLLPNINEF
jgi:5'-3' exonuclease